MRRLCLLSLTLACGCARYAPRPLDLAAAPAAYQARSLSDPALLAALDSLGIHEAGHRLAPGVHPAVAWNDWSLAWAAWVMRPERIRLAAEVRAAEVGVVAAGGRPAPGVEAGVEGTFSGRDGTSPWAVALSGLFRFEFGGKRDARIARSRAAVLAAGARAEVATWTLRLEVRRRLRELRTAWELGLRTGQLVAASDRLVILAERRFHDGVIGRAELGRIRGERDASLTELLDARRRQAEAEARLNRDSGLPAPVPVALREGADAGCDRASAVAPDSLARLALTHRPELALVLAEYQESEADVRIAVAESWPDFEVGPGLQYDHGAGKWTIGLGLPAIPTSYRGPLATAVARREVQAARVAEVQTAVLGEVDAALHQCQAARASVVALHPLMREARGRLQAVQDARERGETDDMPVVQAELEVSRWERRATEIYARQATAELELDGAIGIWNRVEPTESEEPGE